MPKRNKSIGSKKRPASKFFPFLGLLRMENGVKTLFENMHPDKTVCMVWMNATLF